MSGDQRESDEAADMDEDKVVAYLQARPDLLCRHPELIDVLRVPHDSGAAQSLVEYQVKRLRLRVAELESRLQDLLSSARQSEELGRRLNRLVVTLLDCDSFGELATRIYEGMEASFGVEHVCLRLFAQPVTPVDRALGEFLGKNHPAWPEFALVLQGGKPVCGPITQAQSALLFRAQARASSAAVASGNQIGSAALIPLGDVPAYGVLALGSRHPGMFRASMNTAHLRWVGALLTRMLSQHVSVS